MRNSIDDFHVVTLHAGFAEHNADWNWKNVRSPFARIYYVEEGTAQVIIHKSHMNQEEEVINLRPGYIYFIPPFTLHSNVCDGVFKHYYIHVIEDSTSSFQYLTCYSYPRELEAGEHFLFIFRRICEINHFLSLNESDPCTYDNDMKYMYNVDLGKKRPMCDKVESRGILYVIMSRFMRSARLIQKINDERIKNVIDYIDSNMDKDVSVDDLAEIANMSKDHFIRKFRTETGETPITFITKHKVERAEVMLITTTTPVKSIASLLGYDDYTYFIRVFKKRVGVTPQQYRKEGLMR